MDSIYNLQEPARVWLLGSLLLFSNLLSLWFQVQNLFGFMHQQIETPTPTPRATVGASGGMDALLNKTVAQGGGVIGNYWTPTSTC